MVNIAKNALALWAQQLVPSLFPFMILSSLFGIYSYRLFSKNSSFFKSFCQKLFGLSPYGCYILFISHLCGYPMGTKITADACRNGQITTSEAQYLLTICNQSSPAFLKFYVGMYALNGTISTGTLFSLFYLSTFMTSFITRKIYPSSPAFISTDIDAVNHTDIPKIAVVLDQCILDSCIAVLKISGYMVLFSIASNGFLKLAPFMGNAALFIAASLEITCGISFLKEYLYSMNEYVYLVLGLTAFGGFCTMAQIKGMLTGTSLSLKPYIIGKVIYTILLVILVLLFNVIQIVKICI